jgi:hypothetical protein
MTILINPKDAIGHKIKWNSWTDGSHFILEKVSGRDLYGMLYNRYESEPHRNKFVLGKGIRSMTKGNKDASYWYLLEELRIFKLSKLDDKLFEI